MMPLLSEQIVLLQYDHSYISYVWDKPSRDVGQFQSDVMIEMNVRFK